MFTKLAIILAVTFFFTQAAHGAEKTNGHIEAGVCSLVEILDESGNRTGLKCVDCGTGCTQKQEYPAAMNAPAVQTITIIDTAPEQIEPAAQ